MQQPVVAVAPCLKLCDKCRACSRADDDEEEGSSSGPKFELMFCADCMRLNEANPQNDFFGNIPRRKKGAKRNLPPSITPSRQVAPYPVVTCPIPSIPKELVPPACSIPSTPKEKEHIQLSISNLSTECQVLLLESFLTPSSGVLSVRTYFHDSDQRKAKLVDIVFDPIRTSLPTMLASLIELGLDTSIVTDLQDEETRSSSSDITEELRIPCRSSFYVEGICCATEVPIVTSILRNVGVEKVNINITSRMVYVDHFADDHMASELANALTREGFGSSIKKDGGAPKRKQRRNSGSTQDTAESTIASSHLENDAEMNGATRYLHKILPKGLSLNIILSGMFWIISLVGSFDADM